MDNRRKFRQSARVNAEICAHVDTLPCSRDNPAQIIEFCFPVTTSPNRVRDPLLGKLRPEDRLQSGRQHTMTDHDINAAALVQIYVSCNVVAAYDFYKTEIILAQRTRSIWHAAHRRVSSALGLEIRAVQSPRRIDQGCRVIGPTPTLSDRKLKHELFTQDVAPAKH